MALESKEGYVVNIDSLKTAVKQGKISDLKKQAKKVKLK